VTSRGGRERVGPPRCDDSGERLTRASFLHRSARGLRHRETQVINTTLAAPRLQRSVSGDAPQGDDETDPRAVSPVRSAAVQPTTPSRSLGCCVASCHSRDGSSQEIPRITITTVCAHADTRCIQRALPRRSPGPEAPATAHPIYSGHLRILPRREPPVPGASSLRPGRQRNEESDLHHLEELTRQLSTVIEPPAELPWATRRRAPTSLS